MQTAYPEANFERYNLFDIHTCNWNRQVLTKEYEKIETKTRFERNDSYTFVYKFSKWLSVCGHVKHTFTKPCFFRVKANETMWVDLNFGYMRFNLHLRFNCLHIEMYYIHIYNFTSSNLLIFIHSNIMQHEASWQFRNIYMSIIA